jgi:hypothetical protein
MHTIILEGGLGNQLFMIFTILGQFISFIIHKIYFLSINNILLIPHFY